MASTAPTNPPLSPGKVQHGGHLMQLSGKGLLVPGSWKRRRCVLDQRRLYFYQLNVKEENQGHDEKTSHYIDLQSYDICEETKSLRTASNVLVISSSQIEKSFFETGRLYLSAETAAEMNQWISHIRSVMTTLRDGSPPKSEATVGDRSIMSIVDSSHQHLDCITKQRAKGPSGRRLPRQAKSRLVYPAGDVQQQQRSESLSKLEEQPMAVNSRKTHWIPSGKHNRSFDGKSAAATVYAYSSSSDESLHLSSSIQQQQQQQPPSDDETVETLCEVMHHHWTSTPSLTVQPSAVAGWQSVGSSRSTPRPANRSTRPSGYSTSTDDDPPHLLLQQTAAKMTATLATLEANVVASRRDLGWLQENLTTVQNAAGSVSDKVVKMQSTVANMERQINAAVKEAQQLQQRANEALKSASDAERDFRRLESECQSVLNQLRQQQQQQTPLSPMTPVDDDDDHSFPSRRFQLATVPPTFDFAALLTSQQPTRIKSSLRPPAAVHKNANQKSISFGPTTTYDDATDADDQPFATSTLRKHHQTTTPLATIK